jgi:3-phenylpropionate/trans-cinnamate dioxygenase ferredoxin reductase subunit
MLGADEPYSTVPYFFSVLAEWGEVESVGPVSEWDEEVVRGSYDDGSFTTWFIKDGKLNAALTWGRSDDLDHARRMIENPEPLSDAQRAVLRDVDADLGRIGA